MLPQKHQYLRPPARATHLRPRQPARSRPVNPAQPSSTSSSPPAAEQSRLYPISIPPQKLKQAVELYKKYLLADLVSGGSEHGAPSGPSRARSTTGKSTVSQAETAISVSTNGELVNFGEMSFGDQPAGSPTAFDGKKVKVKRRSALSPKVRAKAELIRFLGACSSCRTRRVQCPFDHHDIGHLQRIHEKQSSESQSQSQHQGSQSSNTSGDSSGTLAPETQSTAGSSQGLSTTLLGIGDSLPYTIPDTSMFDLESQPTDAESIQRPSVRTAPLFNTFLTEFEDEKVPPYNALMNGEELLIGLFCYVQDENGKGKGSYKCCYQGCDQSFSITDDLQDHFTQQHFAYSRLDPCRIYTCTNCCARLLSQSNLREAVCNSCYMVGATLWIVGSYIGSPINPPDAPDFQPVGRMSANGSDARSYFSSDSDRASLPPAEPRFNENQTYGNGMHQGGGWYGLQNGTTYPEPSPGNYEFGHAPFGGQFGGNGFTQASFTQLEEQLTYASHREKVGRKMSCRTKLAFLLALLLILFLGPSSLDWFVLKETDMPSSCFTCLQVGQPDSLH